MNFIDCLDAFLSDLQREGIISIGEASGSAKKDAATILKEVNSGLNAKPVVSDIAGLPASPCKIMSHAGTIIAVGKGQAKEKITALQNARAVIGRTLTHLKSVIHSELQQRKILPKDENYFTSSPEHRIMNINITPYLFILL